MFETNVLGTLRMTKALLPALVASGDGHVVTVTLRGELLGQPVRLTEVLPGLVETEFSVVRFGGDEAKAAATRVHRAPRTSAAGTTG
jgi:NADP-dependent 3-hydroxy acid dehydrogenase YdfG